MFKIFCKTKQKKQSLILICLIIVQCPIVLGLQHTMQLGICFIYVIPILSVAVTDIFSILLRVTEGTYNVLLPERVLRIVQQKLFGHERAVQPDRTTATKRFKKDLYLSFCYSIQAWSFLLLYVFKERTVSHNGKNTHGNLFHKKST